MKLLLIAAACLSLLNCTKPARTSNATVRYHQCGSFKSSAVHLCFDSLNDSRCPANAICIWQGDAVARFRFTAQTQHDVTLSMNGLMGKSKDTTLEGYHLRLVNILPFPGTGPADTVAIVEIQ